MNFKMIIYILGQLMRVEGLLMTVPMGISFFYKEKNGAIAFVITSAVLVLIGTVISANQPKNKDIFGREGFVIVALSWILLSAFGAIPFYISGMIPHYIDCFFESVSGFTTTGATIITEIEGLPMGLLFWRSFTHWIGGMGVLVFMLAILPMGDNRSMHIMKAEAPGPMVGKLVPKVKATAKLLYSIYIVLTLLEILFLLFGGMPLFDSIVNAFSTAGTGGFSIKNASIGAYQSGYYEYVIGIFMLLFGINFNLFYLITVKDFVHVFKNEELRYYLGIILFATCLITYNIMGLYPNLETAFRNAFFQVSSIITTTGFVTANYELWPELSKTILIVLTLLGACGGSTGGGLKISRFVILIKLIKRELKHIVHPRSVNIIKLDGAKVQGETINGVTGFFIVYVFLIFFSLVLISINNFDFTTSITAVITCINNVGPGLNAVGPIENFAKFSYFSKLILSMDMLLGRLEIFPIVMLFSPSVWKRGFM